jgi:hypothetical protein
MIHSELVEIRKIRHKISEKYGHDLNQLFEHYKALEAKLKASGKYKFAQRNDAKQASVFGGHYEPSTNS